MDDKEKQDLASEVKNCVREVVHKELPIALVEELAPMVRVSSDAVLKRYRRKATIGFVLAGVAIAILFYQLKVQADNNTKVNHKQDCVLVGLIVGIQGTDRDPGRNTLYNAAITSLTDPGRCSVTTPLHH